ncbi:MAG: hypothetical protein E6R03_17615 [Hyphomicrobiaceae bacterium]|nr:MAG: hypothetical protein E6R03_17615 [Hyphomicrobiaceae bacterium]
MDPRSISIPVVTGGDTATDPKLVNGPTIIDNGRYVAARGTLEKRHGWTEISGNSGYRRFFEYLGLPCVLSTDQFGLPRSTTWDGTAVSASHNGLYDAEYLQIPEDGSATGRRVCIAECQYFTVYCDLPGSGVVNLRALYPNGVRSNLNQQLTPVQSLVSLQRVSATQITAVWIEGTSVKHAKIEWSAGSIVYTAASGVYTCSGTNPYLDTQIVGTSVYVLTKASSGAAQIHEISSGYTGASAPSSRFTGTNTTSVNGGLCVMDNGTHVGWGCAYSDGTVRGGLINGGSTVYAETLIMSAPTALSSTNQCLVIPDGVTSTVVRFYHSYCSNTTTNHQSIRSATLSAGPTASTTSHYIGNSHFAAKPFLDRGTICLPFVTSRLDSVVGDTFFLIRGTSLAAYGVIDATATLDSGNTTSCYPTCDNQSSSFYQIPVRYLNAAPTGSKTGALYSTKICRFRNEVQYSGEVALTSFSDFAVLGTASPSFVAGLQAYTLPFFTLPSNCKAVQSGSGTSKTSGAVYRYAILYAGYDGANRYWRSAPFLSESTLKVTTSGVFDVTLTVTNPPLFPSWAKVEIYSTQANGDVFYYLGQLSLSDFDDTSTFTDNITDANRTLGRTLYTTDLTLENDTIPAHRVASQYQGRYFFVPRAAEYTTVNYTSIVEDGAGLDFNRVFSLTVPQDGGRITALVPHLDKLFIFKERRIFALEGTGPSPQGRGSTYQIATLISDGIGAKTQRLTAATPAGILFQAIDKQFYLLSDSLSLRPISKPMQHWTDTQTFKSISVLPDLGIILCLTSDGSRSIVYDYVAGVWSTYTNYQGVDGLALPRWSDPSLYDFYHLTSSGDIRLDVRGQYFDDVDTVIPLRYTSGFFTPWGLGNSGGVHRVLLIGQNLDSPTLSIKTRYDGSAVYYSTDTFSLSGHPEAESSEAYADAPDAGAIEQMFLEFGPPKIFCDSFGISISDSGASKGWSLSGIILEVSRESSGAARRPVNRRFT